MVAVPTGPHFCLDSGTVQSHPLTGAEVATVTSSSFFREGLPLVEMRNSGPTGHMLRAKGLESSVKVKSSGHRGRKMMCK